MEDLPAVSAYTLSQEPRCGERARRVLDGAKKMAMASLRWRLGQRLAHDAALAHTERRSAHARDFPTPSELTHEERAVYAAAASGYVTLFDGAPALTLDVAKRVGLHDLGIEFVANPGLFVDTDDGTELRVLQVRGTEPYLAPHRRYAAALLTPTSGIPVRIVAADLLSLQIATATIEADDVTTAHEWVTARVGVWQDARESQAFNHAGCRDCEFVWNCPVHPRPRR